MKVKGIFKLIILSSLIISYKIALAQTLQFSSEAIEITISDGYAVVNGDYTFNNISENEINRTFMKKLIYLSLILLPPVKTSGHPELLP